jgi:hypothetical protein
MSRPVGYRSRGEWGFYGVPWAIVLFWILVVYAVIERPNDNLTSSEVLDAAVAAGVLAVGHRVHHAVHYRRHQASNDNRLEC